jgi:hypothetical protein
MLGGTKATREFQRVHPYLEVHRGRPSDDDFAVDFGQDFDVSEEYQIVEG